MPLQNKPDILEVEFVVCVKSIEDSVQRLDGIEWTIPGKQKEKPMDGNCHSNMKYTDPENEDFRSIIVHNQYHYACVSFFQNCDSQRASDFSRQFYSKTIRVVNL